MPKTEARAEIAASRSLRIVIPGRIPAELNPNWNPKNGSGFYRKNSVASEYQYLVYLTACNARNIWEREQNCRWEPLKTATLQVTVYHAGHQKMDDQNLLQSLKSAIDALCCHHSKGAGAARFRAAILEDDDTKHLTHLKPIWIKGEPEVVLQITEALESL